MKIRTLLLILIFPLWLTAREYQRTIKLPIFMSGKSDPVNAKILVGPQVPVTGVALRSDNVMLAVGGYGEVVLWNLSVPKLERRIQSKEFQGNIRSVTFLKDDLLAVGCGEPGVSGAVHILNPGSGKIIFSFRSFDDVVTAMTGTSVGQMLVVGDVTGKVCVYDVITGKMIKEFAEFNGEISGLEFSTDGTKLAVSSVEGRLRVWDVSNWELFAKYDYPGAFQGVHFFRNNTAMAIALQGNDFNGVKIEQVRKNISQKQRKPSVAGNKREFQIRGSNLLGLAITKKGEKVFMPCSDGSIKVIPWMNPQKIQSIDRHRDWVNTSILSRNNRLLVTGDAEGVVKVWDVFGQRLMASLVHFCPGTDDWLAITDKGFYSASHKNCLSWGDGAAGFNTLNNYLYNPMKVRNMMKLQPLKTMNWKKNQQAKIKGGKR